MRALILQFEPDDAPDHLGRRFDAHCVAWDVAYMYQPHAPHSLDGYDVLVSLGGAMSVNEAERYPHLYEAMDLIRAAMRRDVPYLGICLGSQLLAGALGAPVRRNPEKEVGLIRVTLAPGADDDPLLRGLGPVLETAQFHEDTFDLPEGAVRLASSELCANQIVRCGARAYGVQFHPEASHEAFAGWVESAYRDFVAPEKAELGPAIAAEVRAHDATIRAAAAALFDNFIALAAAPHPVAGTAAV